MPTPPYAKILVSVNSGPQQSGGLSVVYGDAIQLSAQSTVGWTSQRWEIFDFPVGFGLPSGWLVDSSGVYYSLAVTPSAFTVPASSAVWGKYLFRLRVNGALSNEQALQQLFDETTAIETVSPSAGLHDMGAGESVQYSAVKAWTFHHKINLRTLDGFVSGGGGPPSGAATGDLSGTYPGPGVAKVKGTSIGTAGGALTTGAVMRVTGVSSADWGPVDLSLASAVTGLLALSHLPIGADGSILTTSGGAPNWTPAAGDVTGATSAFVVGKIKGTAVTTAGGALVTGQSLRVTGVSAADWGPIDLANNNAVTGVLDASHLPASAGQSRTVADIPALQALDTAGFTDATQCMVQELFQTFILVRANTDAEDLSYYRTVKAKQGGGFNGNWLMEDA